MKQCVLLPLLLALGCIHGAPVEQNGLQPGSCDDAMAKSAAGLALTKINQDRKEGYIFSLHRLSNVHTKQHGENGIVFHLTLDVVETNCTVLSKKDWKSCEARPVHDTPVYGQCKAAIFINRVMRVVRLYKYDCTIRPVPSSKVIEVCPDCPGLISTDDTNIQETVSLAVAKFNKDSALSKRFSLLTVTRADSGMGATSMYYNAEFTIQETTCNSGADESADCPQMDCEFAHKGFCKASNWRTPTKDIQITVECVIYEPEAAEREKKLHLLGGQNDHSHNDTHPHAHPLDDPHAKSHGHHDHAHGHDHGHDHAHSHHDKAHDHAGDHSHQHHDYKHAEGTHTHEHDHELALDHDHRHPHLHVHEHHHHHHRHEHDMGGHNHPEGKVRMVASMDQPMTLPSFPDVPAAGPEVGVTLPLKPDPQIPGEMEPVIDAFPTARSAQCPLAPTPETNLVDKMFSEDPLFKTSA